MYRTRPSHNTVNYFKVSISYELHINKVASLSVHKFPILFHGGPECVCVQSMTPIVLGILAIENNFLLV